MQHGPLMLFNTKDLLIYQCTFNLEYFDSYLFTSFGIERPLQIEKSVNKRQSEFLAGRYCCARALEIMGIQQFTIVSGKDRCPIWPEGICGSITHNKHMALAAVAKIAHYSSIGIDIESFINEDVITNIKTQILDEDELALIAECKMEYQVAFTICFSMKEAFFKAVYPMYQKYFDFDVVRVVQIDIEAQTLELVITSEKMSRLLTSTRVTGNYSVTANRVISLFTVA